MDNVPGPLKAFVIGSGMVLVAGTLLLLTLLVLRATEEEPPRDAVELTLPDGATIERVVPDGRRVLLLGTAGDGGQFLAVIDSETGERLSLIRFRGARGAAPAVDR